ncbi:NAD+ synthase [bacterium]|nr:NAD+ synthase [bacterium]
MKVALAQLNPVVGDLKGNLEKVKDVLDLIPEGDADLVVFPELFLTGYPPRDLLTHRWFVNGVQEAIRTLLDLSTARPDLGLLIGAPTPNGRDYGKPLANSALLVENGTLLYKQDKLLLPTYDVFDELRYFHPGEESEYGIVEYKGEKLGISICEDAWSDLQFEKSRVYEINPIRNLAEAGATLMINIAASPFHRNKDLGRYHRAQHHASRWKVPYLAVGQVGANDELIFDGRSVALDASGGLIAALAAFEEEVRIIDTASKGELVYPVIPEIESIRRALVLGLADYARKTGFKQVVLGLSGGIDSALVACIAADALGAENVHGITMPSMYSTTGSVDHSLQLVKNLGIRCDQVPIRSIYNSFNETLAPGFEGREPDVTEENLQARIRGTLLMAYSNKFGYLLLSTGNKSEMAVGYCTLYGDMDGGLSVISDLPKLVVYELSRWYNRDKEVIPEIIITKPPSAELRPDQTDQDSLPPYDVLDPILVYYLEDGLGLDEIVAHGFDRETVKSIIRLVNINEYKRWQAAPGLRVSPKAFGAGRRMPLAAKKGL